MLHLLTHVPPTAYFDNRTTYPSVVRHEFDVANPSPRLRIIFVNVDTREIFLICQSLLLPLRVLLSYHTHALFSPAAESCS